MKPESVTIKNLEAAFAGESMAHIKYLYFAKICRAAGDVESAKVFEETAAQEVQHAFGHLDLLFPAAEMTPAKALEMAIAGETYWTSRSWSRKSTRSASTRRSPRPPNALRRWPKWKSAMRTSIARRWRKSRPNRIQSGDSI